MSVHASGRVPTWSVQFIVYPLKYPAEVNNKLRRVRSRFHMQIHVADLQVPGRPMGLTADVIVLT